LRLRCALGNASRYASNFAMFLLLDLVSSACETARGRGDAR
jgi:hypothetical protein